MEYRRRLPHIEVIGTPVFVTWRLAGSIPKARRNKVTETIPEVRWLAIPDVASAVAEIFLFSQKEFFVLHGWVIMPNHVHLLLTPEVPLRRITNWLKGTTARKANTILGRTGERFWLDESFDRIMRNQTEFRETMRYIEHNPVTAGLTHAPEVYPWSHAGRAG